MADLATLGVVVRPDGITSTTQQLDGLAASAGRADVSAKKVGSSFSNLTGPLGALKVAFAGAIAAAGIGSISNLADEWSDLSSRVNLAAGSVDKGAAVMERLKEVANDTYSSLRLTTESYIENAQTLRALGKSTQDALDYTTALNNAMVISGAKGERAASVQRALSQAMALGKLSGDQLNTIISQGGVVAQALADELGINVLQLRKFGAEGKITGNVIYNALTKRMEQFERQAADMPATIGDAFQRIQNNVLSFVGGMDQASGASGALAGVLLTVADNVDRIIVTVGTAVTAFGTYYVGAMAVATIATGGLTGALTLLRRALIATGIGALVVAAGELVYQLLEARRASDSWGEAFQKVAGRIKLLYEGLKWTFYALVDGMKSAWASGMAFILKSTQATFGPIADLLGVAFGGFGEAISELKKDASDFSANAGDQLVIAGEKFAAAFADFDSGALANLSGDAGAAAKNIVEVDKAAQKAAKSYASIVLAAKERLAQMELEEQLVGKTGVAADVMRMKLDMLYDAQKKGLTLSSAQISELNGLADAYGAVAERVAALQLMEEARFERAQLFRSPIDASIASDLRNAGIEMDSVAGQAYASFKKTTDQISLAKDMTKDFASGFVSDILNGKSAMEALTGALQNLANKLIDMALDQLINGLFSNLLGVVGGGGGAFSPNTTLGGFIGLPGHATGTANTGGVRGQVAGIVHGQEAVIPLPSGGDIPVRLDNDSSGSGGGETYAPQYNFTGTSEEFKQFKQFVLERDKQFNARAVNAVQKGSKKNVSF